MAGMQSVLISPSRAEDDVFQPAASITVYGDSIRLLRDFLNEHYPAIVQPTDGGAPCE